MLSWISLLWQNRVIWVPRKNLKFPHKKTYFLPSEQLYTVITRMLVHSLVEIMEFSQNYDNFYFLVLDDDCKNNMVNFRWKGTTFFNYLNWIKIFDYQIKSDYDEIRSLTTKYSFKYSFISLVQVTQFYNPTNDFLYIYNILLCCWYICGSY